VGREFPDRGQQIETIGVAVAQIVVRKMPAEVTLANCTQNRVGERMRRDIRVGMASQPMTVRDLDAADHQPPPGLQRMKVEALPYSETHGHPQTPCLVDNRQAALQALTVMTEFLKRPKFWIGAIIILWLGYLLTANLSQPVEIYIVPHFIHRTVTAAAVMIVAAVIGCLLTLFI